MTPKRGPYTIDELFQFWQSTVDRGYAQPFVQALRGVGSIDAGADIGTASEQETGYEVFTQTAAQHKRVSEAVDRTCEAMFLMPWSGQSDDPAAGGSRAIVVLTVERTTRFELPLTIPAGIVVIEEEQTDWSDEGGLPVRTGRRYLLTEALHFVPGEAGPKQVVAISERDGYGYNSPQPGTITALVQPGDRLSNNRASVSSSATGTRMLCRPEPDVVVPENIGQTIEFIAGANRGQVRRMLGYEQADPTIPHGGVAVLARTAVLAVSGIAGTFLVGERVLQGTVGGTVSYVGAGYAILEAADDGIVSGAGITGTVSGATANVDTVYQQPGLATETSTATWRVLKWGQDLGVTFTNAANPTGGRSALLDELGRERDIGRAPAESDDSYRVRVHRLPDTISPNAIRRAANRVLREFGTACCLREVGSALFPGLFFDGDSTDVDPAGAFAFDFDFVAQPLDRYKVLLDHRRMRGFFLLSVPPITLGEYGCAYDVGSSDAYDCSPWLAFYDGFAVTTAIIYGHVWQAVEEARGAGVEFELVRDSRSCS